MVSVDYVTDHITMQISSKLPEPLN